MHQPLELVARVIELAVDQGEAFGGEPQMCNGGLGCTRATDADARRTSASSAAARTLGGVIR